MEFHISYAVWLLLENHCHLVSLYLLIQHFRHSNLETEDFRHVKNMEDVIVLILEVINDAPITLSDDLPELLVSTIGEIFDNAFEHSKASYIKGEIL